MMSRRARIVLALAISAVALAVLLVLVLVPLVPITTTGTLSAAGNCGTYCPEIHGYDYLSFPAGKAVEVKWAERSNYPMLFEVYAPANLTRVCFGTNSSGSCSFTSASGLYTFEAGLGTPETYPFYSLNYTATYYNPLL